MDGMRSREADRCGPVRDAFVAAARPMRRLEVPWRSCASRAGDPVGEIIACANQKGGVGKTTTVVSLASYLALDGRRVLIVDLDPQGNATSGLGIDANGSHRSVYDVLLREVEPASAIVPTAVAGLMLLPSDRSLAGAEVELVPSPGANGGSSGAAPRSPTDYDFILLDCPPSLGLAHGQRLTAAHSVLIPIQCEYYALEGLGQLLATIDLVREHLNPGLALKGVILTMHDGRTSLSADVTAEVRRHLGDAGLRGHRAAERPACGSTELRSAHRLYSPISRGALAYQAVAAELLDTERPAARARRSARSRAAYRAPAPIRAWEVA